MSWLVLFFIGLILIMNSIIVATRRHRIYRRGKRIVGKIIDVNEEEIIDSHKDKSILKLYRAVIEFLNDDGELITFITDHEENERIFELGADISLVYDNQKEDAIYLDNKIDLFKLPICILVIGILFLSVSFTLYIL